MAVLEKDENIQIERLRLGPFDTNAYIVICSKTGDSVLIDAPADVSAIMHRLKGTNPKYILLTHNHMDHVGALSAVYSKLNIPIAAHALDTVNLPSPPEMLLNDGDTISFGHLKFEALHTPGHTPGSLCFKTGHHLISGDTIFPGGPGKTWSPFDFSQIIKSITEKIFTLPDDTQIYPGHGDSTVLKKEKEQFTVFSSRPHSPNLCGQVFWLSS